MAGDDDHGNGNDDEPPGDSSPGPPGGSRDDFNVVAGPWWGAGGCPDALIFAVFLEGRLPPSHRQLILAHLDECPACRRVSTEVLARLLARRPQADEVDEAGAATDTTQQKFLRAIAEELAAEAQWESEPPVDDEPAAAEHERSAAPAGERSLKTAPPPPRRRKLATAALAAGLAAVIGVAVLLAWWSTSRDRRVLAASSPRERPLLMRFTGDLPWAPLGSSHAAADYRLLLPTQALDHAATAERRGRPPEAPTAGALGTAGVGQVLEGHVDAGVETLLRASAAQPRSAELLSDLGAALLARAETSDRRRVDGTAGAMAEDRDVDLPAALEAIERALEISPRLEEALFNRALALEQLYLPRSARKAWQAYLDVDGSSEWADEARRRMTAIVVPVRPDPARLRGEIAAAAAGGERERLEELVAAHRQLARRSVQEDLLPRWGEASLTGDVEEAQRQLRAAGVIAEEWEVQTGDRTLRRAVDEAAASTGGVREGLAAGYRAFGEASRAFDAFDIDEALAGAERALATLPPTSPAATWAGLVRLVCDFYRGEEIEGDGLRLATAAPTDPASVGRAYWIVGLRFTRRGEPASALAPYRQSLAAYERLGEIDSVIWLQFLVGDAYARMGASGAAWKHHRAALQRSAALAERQRAQSIVLSAAILTVFEERPRVAADLLAEALYDLDAEQPAQVAQAYLWRAHVLHQLGRVSETRSDRERAAAWLARAPPLERQYLSAELQLTAGLLEVDAARAVDHFTRALTQFRELGLRLRLPGVLLARARAHLRAGSVASADADLRQGLVLLAQQAESGAAAADWMLRLDDSERLFDERVQLALREGQPEEALAIAEASRVRSLEVLPIREPRGPTAVRPETQQLTAIRSRLAAGTTLLFYVWLEDRVVLWRLRQDGVLFIELPSSPPELEQLVAAFRADLQANAWTTSTQETAMRLYAALLSPAQLGAEVLVVVPDGSLHDVPFAALMDPESRRFAIEEHELTIATSASAYVDSRARWQRHGGPPADALVVGDPRVDPLLFPDMRPLAGARREARAVADLYPRHELLLGGVATRRAFLAAVGRPAVVHFSGHAIHNRIEPAQSSLPLAQDASDAEALLAASEIARLDLVNSRTVVLSGCDTGVSEDRRGQVPQSLAQAFLLAGAPNVVASLWSIADASSAPLMTALHRRLRSGERPAEALRGGQLELLHGSDPRLRSPAIWGAFEAFSG